MARRGLTVSLHQKDISYFKPKGFENHLTITELSRVVRKDISWIRRLEAAQRIPKAKRVRHGKLTVRLWSPAQVDEIASIFDRMQVGRPNK